jgi:glycosyltransferase involved in cell wall biosynthesis
VTPRRITFVSDEVRGVHPAGGLGTAMTFLAVGLARAGHSVELVHYGIHSTPVVDPEWASIYEQAGLRVRFLARGVESVEPAVFARTKDVEAALRADPPDVVVTQDSGAPAYAALRLRALGLAFEDTRFLVFCHGTRSWIKHANRNVRAFPALLATGLLEQASLELADAVVSPSAYLVGWMRAQGWELPERTLVIPYVTRSAALGEPVAAPSLEPAARHVRRLAFFGRLEERKGLRPFAAAVNALEPELLGRIELEFVGGELPWTVERVEALLSPEARAALRGVTFETELDQHEALDRLRRPGTLAVMPSLEDNSPNTVYECLEHGIPFLTSDVGGAGELVAPADRERALFEPTAEGIERALRRALADGGSLTPLRPGFDARESLRRWLELVDERSRRPEPGPEPKAVDVVVVHRGSREALDRCLAALERQSRPATVTVVLAGPGVVEPAATTRIARSRRSAPEHARAAALASLAGEWVVFLDEDDVPDPELVATLVRAQAASGADVVSCGLRVGDALHLFHGRPRALGALANGYGTVALLRRSLMGDVTTSWPVEADPDWPLLAGLAADGAKIVSVPEALVTRTARPGAVERHPSDALLVIERLERTLPGTAASLARLAAGSAADAAQRATPPPSGGLPRRAARRLARIVR